MLPQLTIERMHILRMHRVPASVPAWCGAVYHAHCYIPIRYVCRYAPCAWSARLLLSPVLVAPSLQKEAARRARSVRLSHALLLSSRHGKAQSRP